jgi:hypothetical protein
MGWSLGRRGAIVEHDHAVITAPPFFVSGRVEVCVSDRNRSPSEPSSDEEAEEPDA